MIVAIPKRQNSRRVMSRVLEMRTAKEVRQHNERLIQDHLMRIKIRDYLDNKSGAEWIPVTYLPNKEAWGIG